jgi:predicted SAM-dependent methyltransferase
MMTLKNTFLILKPGGLFRGVVPDLRSAAIDYIQNFDRKQSPATDFMRNTMLGIEEKNKNLISYLKSFYGNSKHLWMWDYKSLQHELQIAGFKNIRPCEYGDSSDIHFSYVEDESRFYKAAAFECQK